MRVAASGEIDIATAPLLAAQLHELLDLGWADVVADLREVTFMDSAGVHVLADVHRRAAERSAAFSILDGGTAVRLVLRVTTFDEVLRHTGPERAT